MVSKWLRSHDHILYRGNNCNYIFDSYIYIYLWNLATIYDWLFVWTTACARNGHFDHEAPGRQTMVHGRNLLCTETHASPGKCSIGPECPYGIQHAKFVIPRFHQSVDDDLHCVLHVSSNGYPAGTTGTIVCAHHCPKVSHIHHRLARRRAILGRARSKNKWPRVEIWQQGIGLWIHISQPMLMQCLWLGRFNCECHGRSKRGTAWNLFICWAMPSCLGTQSFLEKTWHQWWEPGCGRRYQWCNPSYFAEHQSKLCLVEGVHPAHG